MLKRFAWFIFKSPQRKNVGVGTLWTDIKGIFGILFRKKSHEEIWVCVGVKNRTDNLKRLVSSLQKAEDAGSIALSIADAGSDDAVELKTWLGQSWKGKLVWSAAVQEFHRAEVFNRAIRQAEGNFIFVCDADMTVPVDLVKQIRRHVRPTSAWFPVCQWQMFEDMHDWKWFTAGTGLFAAHKKWQGDLVYYNETIKGWGAEDWDMFFRFYQKGIMPLRSRCNGLYHHWHQSMKPADWNPLF